MLNFQFPVHSARRQSSFISSRSCFVQQTRRNNIEGQIGDRAAAGERIVSIQRTSMNPIKN